MAVFVWIYPVSNFILIVSVFARTASISYLELVVHHEICNSPVMNPLFAVGRLCGDTHDFLQGIKDLELEPEICASGK